MKKSMLLWSDRVARSIVPGCLVSLLALAGCAGTAGPSTQVPGDEAQGRSTVSLSPDVLGTIQAATFEVVVKKPPKDSLSYEKPLPLDLLPYSVRNDKYESRGTAFAIAANRFISAAHVLDAGSESQHEGAYLRDSKGNVYSIDQVWKYSHRRDFIVFSVKNGTAKRVFQLERRAPVNAKVYAVGNALGKGIVIRDGLHTSDTPEERDGAWKFIRFSAAASPGNSGGPLLDQHGRVIGIVLAKSENENLNFALPITEVLQAKDRIAEIDMKMAYSLDNMPITKIGSFRHELPLPMSFAELNRRLVRILDQEGTKLMTQLLRENRDQIFPNGAGSKRLLHSNFSTLFPGIIAKASDGTWSVYTAESDKRIRAKLGTNGHLAYGSLGASVYFRLRMPDDVSLRDLTGNSKRFMDLFLKGADYKRTVAAESIKITSLGQASSESILTDAYRRKWLVKTWRIEFSDQVLVMLGLPVPDGIVGMFRIVSTGERENHLRDLKALADFIYVSYYGTLEQWQRFLAMKDLLPAAFSDINLRYAYGGDFSYRSSRVAFSYPSALMKVTRDSDLQLGFSYLRSRGKVVWDVAKVVVGEDKNTGTAFTVIRNRKPSDDMDDDYKSNWSNLSSGKYPYNKAVSFNDGRTSIGTGIAHPADKSQPSAAPALYAVWHIADGTMEQETGRRKLDNFIKGLEVREHEIPGGARQRVAGK